MHNTFKMMAENARINYNVYVSTEDMICVR